MGVFSAFKASNRLRPTGPTLVPGEFLLFSLYDLCIAFHNLHGYPGHWFITGPHILTQLEGIYFLAQAALLCMLDRLELENWLDPFRTGSPSPFNRPNLFAKPTQLELRRGLRQLNGARMVNCLDPNLTHFPQMTPLKLNELWGWPQCKLCGFPSVNADIWHYWHISDVSDDRWRT